MTDMGIAADYCFGVRVGQGVLDAVSVSVGRRVSVGRGVLVGQGVLDGVSVWVGTRVSVGRGVRVGVIVKVLVGDGVIVGV